MDDFEQELRQAMERRPAPPSLKRKILLGRNQRRMQRFPSLRIFQWGPATAVLAAMIVVVIVAAGAGGVIVKRQAEERRRGEEAKQQVMTALRITTRALNQMNAQLAARNRDAQ